MKSISMICSGILAVTALGCLRPPEPPPRPEKTKASVEYWITGMKNIRPAELDEDQRKQKERFLELAWNQLMLEGAPAARRIREELAVTPDDAYFQLSASMVLYQIQGSAAHPDIIAALERSALADNPFQYFYLCHRLAHARDERVLPVLRVFLANEKTIFIDKDAPMLDAPTACIYVYGVFGPGAVPALMEACNDLSPTVRANAASVLGYFGDTTPLALLPDMLKTDSAERVRASAANALGQMDHTAAVPPLAAALTRDGNPSVRAACAFALGELQDSSCLNGLTIAVNDISPPVREYAVVSIELLMLPECAEVLENRLAIEKHESVRLLILRALGNLGFERSLTVLQKIIDADTRESAEAARAYQKIRGMGPAERVPYPDLDGNQISESQLDSVFATLWENYGAGIDTEKKTIFLSATAAHLPKLDELRSRILLKVTDDALYRLGEVTKLMRLIKRRDRGLL